MEESLLISTLATGGRTESGSRARIACLTVACHPDPARIGERALLTPLLVRQPVRLSRVDTAFAHPEPGVQPARPLLDPYLSREPIRLLHGPDRGSVAIEGLQGRALVDGQPAGTSCTLASSLLDRGVLLQLSSRVLLILHATAAEPPLAVDGILGYSDAIDRVRRQIVQVAALDTPVLIRGESGVGKECVAHALHAASRRRGAEFVAVNMATLSEATAASALFGHARGAFTGAVGRHRGYFERADGGTLFLDEVGDTPATVQPMLLRALESGRIQPLGSDGERTVDVRVLAATDADLDGGSQERPGAAFRLALKHRLAGYEIAVAPLRERLDDVPRLFVHFLRLELCKLGQERLLDGDLNAPAPPLRSELMARLLKQSFPGNVRELINVARRIAIDAAVHGGAFELDERAGQTEPPVADEVADAGPAGQGHTGDATPPPDAATLLDVLERHAFSPQRAAAELGVPPSTVHFWMRRHGIRRAADLDPSEIERAYAECEGDVAAMARQLRVSERAIRLALRRRR